MVRSHRYRQLHAEGGAAAVEFAIIVPVLLLIVAGIVDFGRAFFTEIQLANAAREGARAAVVSTISAGDIKTRAETSAPGLTLTFPVLQQCPSGDGNATVEVQTSFNYIILGPAASIVGGSIADPGALKSKAVMKCGG